MYKDKNKQKEANRRAKQRQRAKGMTHEGMTGENVIPELPANFGQEDCECRHCRNNRNSGGKLIINHGEPKPMGVNEVNRVSLPGDVDYGDKLTAQF